MYKMKPINALVVITIICFLGLESYVVVDLILRHQTIGFLNFLAGSLGLLIISLLIGLIFIPIASKYFFYDFTDREFIRKYYFWTKKINLEDIKSINFKNNSFEILLKNGEIHCESNKMNKKIMRILKHILKKLYNFKFLQVVINFGSKNLFTTQVRVSL